MSNPAIDEVVAQYTTLGDHRIECPACGQQRRKKHQKTLSITVHPHETLYLCHHCTEAGKVIRDTALHYPKVVQQKVTKLPTQFNQDHELIIKFFAQRGITITDMSQVPPMTTGEKFFANLHEQTPAVGFIYGNKDRPSAIKWRSTERKAFTQDNAAREFYNIDKIDADALAQDEKSKLIIVEGEADAVALATIGITAVSCPNGAPMKVSHGRILPEEDTKFSYIWEARTILESAKRIILLTDQDQAGEALKEEIARRVGRAKCWQVSYPEGCKDITDVIREFGADTAKKIIEDATAIPLQGVYGATDYAAELYDIYREGHGKGEETGIDPEVDELFTIKPGQLTVVTGLPSSGKSEFIDQIMVNLAKNKSWKFAVASFENPPAVHIAKLAEKVCGKPFYEGITPRLTRNELDEAVGFINDHFVFLEQRDGNMPTVDQLLDRARQAVMRLGCRGLCIDPFNYIDLGKEENEHQAISNMLTKITTFAKAYDIHIWFVAHPAKMRAREDGSFPVPVGHHISGSAAWFSKADIGISVHRGPVAVEIHCWKVRFKWIGRQGVALLDFDVPTGRYLKHVKEIDWGDQTAGRSAYKKSKSGFDELKIDDLEF